MQDQQTQGDCQDHDEDPELVAHLKPTIRKHFKPNSFTTVLILAAIHRSWQTSENMTSSAFELLIFNSDDNDDDRDVEPEVSCR